MSSPASHRTDSGWAVFAGVLFLLAGVFHVMWGIAAVAEDDNFVADELLFGDLSLWGVFYLVLGALQLLAAWLIATGRRSGQIIGLALAFTTVLVMDLLVIYGLSVHGDDYA
jgi:hypothetical protein